MTGAAILVIWTVVASVGSSYAIYVREKDWRPIGEFSSVAACTEAARQLNVKPENFRCLPK